MAASLIGQPLGRVRERLQLLGLDVRVQRHLSRQETGTVLAVQPKGKVLPASTIVLTVAFMRDRFNDGDRHHHHRNDGGQRFPASGTVADYAAHRSGR
jgi:PASTA domain